MSRFLPAASTASIFMPTIFETCGPGSRARAAVTTRPARYGRSATAILASVSPSGIRRPSARSGSGARGLPGSGFASGDHRPFARSAQDEPAIALDEAGLEEGFVVPGAAHRLTVHLADDQLAEA